MINTKIVWALFVLSALFAVGGNLAGFGLDSDGNNLAAFLAIALPFLAVLSHAYYVLGAKRAVFFLFLSFFTGFVFEAIAVNFGLITGGSYTYDMPGPALAGVPLSIPVFWFVFIYSAYGLINAAVIYYGGSLPNKETGNYPFLLYLITLNAILVMMIDLVMDPVMISWGEWTWQGGGWYFDIPAENFLGWLAIGLIAGGIFRTYEYYHPKINSAEKNIHLIPVLGYFTVIFFFTYFAYALTFYSLAVASILIYIPIIIASLKLTGKFSFPGESFTIQRQDIPKLEKITQTLPKQK
jgi:bisanhydrobacterioruberin hydratase